LAVAGERLGCRPERLGDRLAGLGVGHPLDRRRQVADLAGRELFDRAHVRTEHADLLDLIRSAVGHEEDPRARSHPAVGDPHVDDHALVGVVEGIEHQRLQRRLGVADRRRDARDDGLQHLGHTGTVLGRDRQRLGAVEVELLGDLLARALQVGRWQVDLVDHRDDGQPRVGGQVEVGQRLGLDPLGGIDDQDGPLTGGQRAGDLVGEVDVPRRVDEVERVDLTVPRAIEQPDRVRLDGDAALALQVHRVKDLVDRLLGVHRPGQRQQAVGQRRLAVIDVGDNREVSDERETHAVSV